MARKSRRRTNSITITAENIGATLGHVAARVEKWKKQRAELAADLQHVLKSAQKLLDELGETAGSAVKRVARTSKGGRPKGFRVSAATRRKLRAAWKRRKSVIEKLTGQ